MNLQQFQADEPLRVQRMTADEAASVIALWQQERAEHTGLTNKPSVPDVAEGLDITVEDVQRLLNDVRAQRLEEERALTQEQELATAEMRLADEEARLADIQQRRAQIQQEEAEYGREQPAAQLSQSVEPVKSVWSPNSIVPWLIIVVSLIIVVALVAVASTKP